MPLKFHWKPSVGRSIPTKYALVFGLALALMGVGGAAQAEPEAPSRYTRETLPQDQEYMLALSWFPGFCELHYRKKDRPNFRPARTCLEIHPSGWSAQYLTLHGLWPQKHQSWHQRHRRDNGEPTRFPEYCTYTPKERAKILETKWLDLEDVVLPSKLMAALSEVMPGVREGLHLHEWHKHGTCSGLSPEAYFALSLRLTREAALGADWFMGLPRDALLDMPDLCNRVRAGFGEDGLEALSLGQRKGGGAREVGDYLLKDIWVLLRPGPDGRLDLVSSDFTEQKRTWCEDPGLTLDGPVTESAR